VCFIQAATPTRVGRELMVFVERLENQLVHLENYTYFGTGCRAL
jgi:adenylosuccinate lyase